MLLIVLSHEVFASQSSFPLCSAVMEQQGAPPMSGDHTSALGGPSDERESYGKRSQNAKSQRIEKQFRILYGMQKRA
jgi:hypothetical protein